MSNIRSKIGKKGWDFYVYGCYLGASDKDGVEHETKMTKAELLAYRLGVSDGKKQATDDIRRNIKDALLI